MVSRAQGVSLFQRAHHSIPTTDDSPGFGEPHVVCGVIRLKLNQPAPSSEGLFVLLLDGEDLCY